MPFKTIIILPDTHFRPARDGVPSGEDSQLLRRLVLPFMRERRRKIDFVVHLGDVLDLPSLSRHEAWREIDEAIDLANDDFKYGREWMAELYEEAPNAHWRIIEGNHDFRCKSFCTSRKQRHLLESLDFSARMGLGDYANLRFIPYWSDKRRLVRLGKAAFCHGLSVTTGHAKVMAARYPGTNLYYGHVHDHQSYSPPTFEKRSANEAMSLGTLCRLEQPYMQGAPNNWRNMFAVMYLFPDGTYTMTPVSIIKGKFVFDQKEYNVNAKSDKRNAT